MAEGAISQTLYSRPRWWSDPCVRSLLTLHDGRRSSLPSALLLAALVEQALRTKIHTETCWRENAFTQTFSFTNVHRANFLPNLPAMPRVPGLEAVCAQATVRNGLSSYSPRAFHHIIAANSANRVGHSRKTLRPFQQNTSAFSAKRHGFYTKTPRPFHQNAPAFSTKHFSHFSKTLQPFQQNASTFSPKRDTGRSRVSPCAPPGAWMSRL